MSNPYDYYDQDKDIEKNMDHFSLYFLLIFMIGVTVGFVSNMSLNGYNISHNKIEGYHCGKLTKHKTLESAKAQVNKHQAMTGVK